MRPILRPGCHVLRRGRHEIQVGLDPARAVVLDDGDTVQQCLARLRVCNHIDDYDTAEQHATLRLLARHDLLVDADGLLPLVPATPGADRTPDRTPDRAPVRTGDGGAGCSPAQVAALARRAGDRSGVLVRRRARTRVALAAFGHPRGSPLCDDLDRLLTRAGLLTRIRTHHPRPGPAPDVVVLVGVGEPRRELLDPWVRAGVPHLLVRVSEGTATLGPFVQPGENACLRCLDAHHTDADPAWPLLVEQYAALSGAERCDGAPEPVDVPAASMVLAWATHDLASFADGGTPSTWSTTVHVDPAAGMIETRSWLRHPECGCAWDDRAETRLASSATMEP